MSHPGTPRRGAAGLPFRLSAARLFWPAAAALLAVQAAAQYRSARMESQTWDEGIHLAAGYSYWKTGVLRMNAEHPPLSKWLQTAPLLWLGPSLPLEHPSWAAGDSLAFGHEFLYRNRVPADTLLLAGRTVTMALTALLGLALAWWTRRRFGALAALIALALYALDPNITAHGRYVTTDLPLTLTVFAACLAWVWHLESGRKRALAAAAALAGLAAGCKFSGLFVPAAFGVLSLAYWSARRPARFWRRLPASFAAVFLGGYLVLAALYWPEFRRFFPMTRTQRTALGLPALRHAVDQSSPLGVAIATVGPKLGLVANSFWSGLGDFAAHNRAGHESYLLGRRSTHGWWYYLPAAFVVKTPVAALAALLIALALARRASLGWNIWLLLLPPATYVALAVHSHINLGLRHLLPVYPFLYVLAGAVLARALEQRWRLALLPGLALALAFEWGAIYPHYLAFFNFAAGGPEQGPSYLVDSNIDWGQDVLHLKRWMEANGVRRVCPCYFGNAELAYYGIEEGSLPHTSDDPAIQAFDCVAAVSATPLMGVYVGWDAFRWLREKEPTARIGYSIYVYDLRR